MNRKLFISLFFFGVLISCNDQTKILLQKEEKAIYKESIEFRFPETTSGVIRFDYFINSGFTGSILLQDKEGISFDYQIDTNRKLYPLNNEINSWQQISLEWNLENSSLKIFVNEHLQTIRLIKSEKIKSINKFILKPVNVKPKNSITIRNVSYKGGSYQLPHRLKIVTFGNSTTAFRNTITGVYTQRLPELLLKKGIPNIIYNEGVPGSHTGRLVDNDRHKVEHALDRFEKAVLEKSPDIVIICFGLNDSWHDNYQPRIALEDYEKNLRFMIEEFKKSKCKIILLTPNALGDRFEKWRYDYTEKYVGVVRELSGEYNLPLVDQWKSFEDYASKGNKMDDLLLDGIHPNDKWHEVLAKKIVKEILLVSSEI